MKLKRGLKVLSYILAVCMLTGVMLTGCGGSKNDQPAPAATKAAEPQATKAPEAEKKAEKVTIRLLTRYSGTDATTPILKGVIEEFTKTHPNVTVQDDSVNEEAAYNNKLKTDFATGNPPSMFYLAGVMSSVEYAKNGLLMDVSPMFADKEWYDGFVPGSFETWNFEPYGVKGYYGVPFSVGVENFYYNKELFEKAGIKQVPETMDDLYAAIDKLKGAGIIPWGVGAKATWRAGHIHNFFLYKTVGVQKVKDLGLRKAKWTDPDIVETLKLLKDLKARGAFEKNFEGIDYDTEKANFLAGKYGMVLNGSWFVGDIIKSNIKDKIGVFKFPYFKDKPQFKDDGVIFPQGQCLSGKMKGAEKDATIEFVKLMFGKKWQEKMVKDIERLSARKDINLEGANLSPVFKEVAKFANEVKVPGGDSFDFDPLPSMQDRTRNSIIGMFLQNTPEAAAKEIQDEIDKNKK